MRLGLLLILSFPLWAQFQNVPSTRYPGLEAILNAKPAAQVAAGVPSGNCTVGKDFYVNSTAHTLYYCSATNTWVQIAGATASTTVNGTTCTLGSTCTVTAAPSGSAGGDLAGTYPNPTLKNKGAANGPVMADGSGNVAITGALSVTPIANAPALAANSSGQLIYATALGIIDNLWDSGCQTSPSGKALLADGTCATLGINGSGSIIGANFNNTLNASFFNAGNTPGGGPNACASSKPSLWPISGFVRNVTVTTSTTNGNVSLRANAVVDCQYSTSSSSLSPGGAYVLPGAVAGGYVGNNSNNSAFVHATQGGAVGFETHKQQSGGTAAQVTNVAAEFVADSGVWTIFPAATDATFNASANNFVGAWGATLSTTELAAAIPIPANGTLQNFAMCTDTGSPTNAVTATVNVNGTPSALTFTIAGSVAAASCFFDATHTAAVTAGQYVDQEFVTGATTQTSFGIGSFGFTPSSGSTTIIGGSINGGTVSTTASYNAPLSTTTNATVANASLALPRACSVSKLYLVQITANGAGVTTTFTLEKNGSDTAITGTVNQASGTGAIAVDTSHTVSFAKGDLMSLKYVTASGTSGTIGAWTVACD